MRIPEAIEADIRDLQAWLTEGSSPDKTFGIDHHLHHLDRNRMSEEDFRERYRRDIGYQIAVLERELLEAKTFKRPVTELINQ